MSGIVKRPHSTTFETAVPITAATAPLPMIAGAAAPPLRRPPTSRPASTIIGIMPEAEKRRRVDHEEEDVVGRGLREQEEALRDAQADVAHHEGGLVAGVRQQRVVDVLAVEEVGDRERHDGGQRRPQWISVSSSTPTVKTAAHGHVEADEKRSGLLEAIGIAPGCRRAAPRPRAASPLIDAQRPLSDPGELRGVARRGRRRPYLLVTLVPKLLAEPLADEDLERGEARTSPSRTARRPRSAARSSTPARRPRCPRRESSASRRTA